MRISEQIEALFEVLAQFGDLPVFVDGYEGGYQEGFPPVVMPLYRTSEHPGFFGTHDEDPLRAGETEAVVVIRRSVDPSEPAREPVRTSDEIPVATQHMLDYRVRSTALDYRQVWESFRVLGYDLSQVRVP